MAKSKRLKKKQQTRQQKEILSAKYSPKEIKNLGAQTRKKEAKRVARNEKRKADRAESKQFLLNQGLDPKFISKNRLYDRQVKAFDSRELLRLKKQNSLEKAGVNYKVNDLNLGWVKLQEKYPNISIPENAWKNISKTTRFQEQKYWLYVGAAAAGNDGFEMTDFGSFSITDFETHINMIVNHAKKHPDGSGRMHCVYKVYIRSAKEPLEKAANTFYERGYSLNDEFLKLDNKSYDCITLSNKWNKREFLNMTLSCLSQMLNYDVGGFIDDMKRYCRLNNVDWMKNIESIEKPTEKRKYKKRKRKK